jgi:hypothetical protein
VGELAVSGKAAFFAYFLCGGKESKSPKAKALKSASASRGSGSTVAAFFAYLLCGGKD